MNGLDGASFGFLRFIEKVALPQFGDDSTFHLRCGLFGESDREDLAWAGTVVLDEVEVALGEHRSLARTGRGDNDKLALGSFDNRLLFSCQLNYLHHFLQIGLLLRWQVGIGGKGR